MNLLKVVVMVVGGGSGGTGGGGGGGGDCHLRGREYISIISKCLMLRLISEQRLK